MGKYIMPSSIAIFMTRRSDYNESDYVFENGTGFLYAGQKKGLENFKLQEAVDQNHKFYVYMRYKKSTPFLFMGSTRNTAVDDYLGEFRVIMNGDNMYPTIIKNDAVYTHKQNALSDFMIRNGADGKLPKKVNLMKGFYIFSELDDPTTYRTSLPNYTQAMNWDIAHC